MTTALQGLLEQKITREGPITVAEFMETALAHPEHGYYRTRDPLGAAGDFTTSPEISQIFGELIGLWCAVLWQQMGAPDPVRLIELGPGRGTLMADLARAGAMVPAFRAALRIHLVETSPALRDRQAQALAGLPVQWHDDLSDVPDGPALVIANEFFDALPIRQFVRRGEGWRERLVGLGDAGKLVFLKSPILLPLDALPEPMQDAAEDEIAETCPAALDIIDRLALRLSAQGGAALIVDYGAAASQPGESLQAVKRHEFHPVLEQPGEADLTAHVDFQALARAAAPRLRAHGPRPQGHFLLRLGAEARLQALCDASPERAHDLRAGCYRLIDPRQMGTLFKVLTLASPTMPVPPGFEE